MKNKLTQFIMCAAVGVMLLSLTFPSHAYASDGEDYITISVDAVDDNSDLQYALDSDDPAAFTRSNEFRVPAGTSHTIYVKDAAGNVTSQRYEPQSSGEDDEDAQEININLELGHKSGEEYAPDEEGNPGTASVTNRTKTDGSVDAEKVFYTFTTKEGEELYLVVDQGRGADNVYLLDTVSLGDLRVLADGHESSSNVTSNNEKEDNLLSILAAEESTEEGLKEIDKSKEKNSSSGSGNPLLIILFVAIGSGIYYYLKIYRAKKDEAMDTMDAMDMDEFEPEEEEEEVEFGYDEEEKERYLENLLNEDDPEDDLLDADPNDYAETGTEESDPFYEEVEEDDDVDIF